MIRVVFQICRTEALVGILIAFICMNLMIGGASRYWLEAHHFLQSSSAIGIALLVVTWPQTTSLRGVRVPIGILCAMIIVAGLQCVPLSIELWGELPGRKTVLEGYEILNVVPVTQPISLDVEATYSSLGYALSPLFVLLLCVRIGMQRLRRRIPTFLCAAGVASVVLGLLQVFSGEHSILYLYENTSRGFPVGTFANVNHFASLLLMVFPLAVLMLTESINQKTATDRSVAFAIIFIIISLLLCVGIAAAGSLAVYVLITPVALAAFIGTRSFRVDARRSWLSLITVFSLLLLSGALVMTSPNLSSLGVVGSPEDPTSRYSIWTYTIDAIQEYWPVGAGAGTYQSVIPQFENLDTVVSRYVALAHNEYLQLIMEYGAAGLLIIVISAVWLFERAKAIWFTTERGRTQNFRKMILISIFVCVAHSIVDYPARTPAIASVLGLFIALISIPNEHSKDATAAGEIDPRRVVL